MADRGETPAAASPDAPSATAAAGEASAAPGPALPSKSSEEVAAAFRAPLANDPHSYRLLSSRSFFGADIGGSLAKVVFHEPADIDETSRKSLLSSMMQARQFLLNSETYGGTGVRDTRLSIKFPDRSRMHFIMFETRRIAGAFQLLLANPGVLGGVQEIGCTGGGAYKYGEEFQEKFGTHVVKYDEMECLVTGINFLLRNVPDEVFVYPDGEDTSDPRPFAGSAPLAAPEVYQPAEGESIHPYLLANVGSGVSFVVVDEHSQERIAGSALGGATYWGLVRALTSIRDYEQSLEMAREGSAENINMTVGDIYGGVPYKSLPPNMTAAFFGKAISDEPPLARASEADVCNAVLFMVTNNLGQLAYLNALRFGISRIFFSGSFLRSNETSRRALDRAIKFWSGGKMKAHFFKHEGFAGSVGALVLHNAATLNRARRESMAPEGGER
ncbi:type II pantothenate kinase [Hyaloraphidium curvatum]|nr:type II pantothenate kinase [Hyaloraphidium curvatum]